MGIIAIQARRKAGAFFHIAGHPYARIIPALLIGAWFFWVLLGRLEGFDWPLLAQGIGDISLAQWGIAVLATVFSFRAAAGYDIVAARSLDMRIAAPDARRMGFVATALAQLIGLGLITGSLARWRILGADRFSLLQATILTMVVTGGFMIGSVALIAVCVLIGLDLSPAMTGLAAAVLVVFAGVVLMALMQPDLRLRGQKINIPKLRTLLDFCRLCTLDLGLAALAFWALVPPEAGVSFVAILPVFLLATGFGILSGIPGGVGPFELICLGFLPLIGDETLMTAVLAFRLIYFLLPGLLAIGVLIYGELVGEGLKTSDSPMLATGRGLPPRALNLLTTADRAEMLIVQDGGFNYLETRRMTSACLAATTANTLVAFCDPVGPQSQRVETIHALVNEAQANALFPAIYKCDGSTAKAARNAGLSAYKIGHDAILDPTTFCLSGPAMRGLRRKLAHAQRAGVLISPCHPADLPLDQMQAVSDNWVATRGGERGFSMGRFDAIRRDCRKYYLAWQGNKVLGFIGLWQTQHECALDLMRWPSDAPDGVTHAMICAVISDLAAEGKNRLSLASVPFFGLQNGTHLVERFANWLYHHRPDWHGAQGLYRFKASFQPSWEPRYLVANGPVAAAVAAFDIARAITAKPGSAGNAQETVALASPTPNRRLQADETVF